MNAHFSEFDRWPVGHRRSWQVEQIRKVLAYTKEASVFYREVWAKAGIEPDSIDSWDAFRSLPIVNKNQMIRHDGPSAGPKDARVGFSTRGTSGNPLVLWLDREEAERYILPTVRGFAWAGLSAGDKAVILSPSWHRLAAMEGHAVVRLGAQPNYFWGTLSDAAHAEPFVDTLLEVRPQFVTSTPPFILNVIKHCGDRGVDPAEAFSSVRSVVLAGVALTPGLKRHLVAKLGVEHVFERGGTQEGAALDECHLHTGMHVHEDVCHLEVLDKGGDPVPDGTPGRLIVTKLVPAGSPFVRYDTGDTAIYLPGECGCGSKFNRLRILGRPESTIRIKGQSITAHEVRTILDEQPDLVGRLSLLVRNNDVKDRLHILIEGQPADTDPAAVLREQLGPCDILVEWMGGAGLSWGFRQVIDIRELRNRRPT